MNSIIPIFPLSLVVFPQSKYPLHIFEERYKKMINRCIEEKTGFGIVAKIGDNINKIGCYVTVSTILKKYDGGEMDIIVTGQERFSMLDFKMHSDGYYESEIQTYNDVSSGLDENLLTEAKEKFYDIIDIANYKLDNGFWENFIESANKSFKLAEKSGLKLEQQQQLLMIRSENERLAFLIDHFEKLSKLISENSLMKTIVLGDGYLN